MARGSSSATTPPTESITGSSHNPNGGTPYTTLDDPLATNGTQAFGINDAGQIVGTYDNATGTHAFIYSGGNFTTVDDPVTGHTFAHGINNSSQIAGTLSDGTGNHGFLETTIPNPAPPPGTAALMIMSDPSNGTYEVYNVGGNAILAAYQLIQVGTSWTFAALGTFQAGDRSDMLLRNSSTGAFQAYYVSGNNITNTALVGTVGLDWNFAGIGNFDGASSLSELMLRHASSGSFELYQVAGGGVLSGSSVAPVGNNFQV